MKRSLILFAVIFTLFGSVTFAHSYDVDGVDDYGRSLEGQVESWGSREVEGELLDEYSNYHSFDGEWDGYGHISGYTDDGASVELDVS